MLLLAIIISLLFSALFSGAEIAFLSANKLSIELKKKRGSPQSVILSRFYENPSAFLGAMLVGNVIALVVFTALATIPLERFFREQLGVNSDGSLLLINTIIITLVVLVFGEFLPKTLFRLFSGSILYVLAQPLRLLYRILLPPAWITTRLSHFLLVVVLRSPHEEVSDAFTRLDLENFIKTARSDSNDEIDTELFEKALNLRDIRVRESMIPRPEIEAVEVNATFDELIRLFQETGLSRIIVYEDDIDNVLGYVHHLQLLNPGPDIRSMVMEISFVPDTMPALDLMRESMKNRLNIACVVDEYGGTAGVITMEDILEEIFGDIEDEHDEEEYIDEQISESEFRFSGRLEIAYLNEKYPQLNLPEGDYHTLSGYLVMTTANIPVEGFEIVLHGLRFILESVSETKVETVRILILPAEEAGA